MAQNLWSGIPQPQAPDLGNSFAAGRERVFGEQRQARADQRDKNALIAQYAVSADTPEKWAAAMDELQGAGVPDARQFANRFDLRDQIIERSYATPDQMNSRTAGQFLSSLGMPQGAQQSSPQPQGATLSTGFLSSLGAAPPVNGSGMSIPSRPDMPMRPGAPATAPQTAGAPQSAPMAATQPQPPYPARTPGASAQPMGYDGLDSRLPGLTPMAGVSATNQLRGAAGVDTLRPQLARSESGGRSNIVNAQGYSGTYQMGEGALADAGVYRDATPGVQNDWNGEFAIPGHPEVRTQQDFLQNPDAQEAAFGAHLQRLERDMKAAGMEQYIGQEVGGVPITAEGLVWMAHLGGVGGTKRFLETGGRYDPADSNGTRLSDYARRAAGGAGEGSGGQVRSATRDVQAPTPNGVPMASLQILARNPTYAGTAIESAMGQYAPRKPTEGVVINGRLVNPTTGGVMGDYRTNEGMAIDLTPEQAKSLGFPAGTVVQRKADNTLEVVQKAPEGGGGPFQGNALDAQDSNILLRGDPASPEYALAYQRQFLVPKTVQVPDPNNPGQMMWASVQIAPPTSIRPPAGMPQGAASQPQQQPPAPQGAVQPQQEATPSTPTPGSVTMQPIPGTSKPLVATEQQRLDAGFADRMDSVNQTLERVGDQGANYGQRALNALPFGLNNYATSSEFQQYDQAKRDFINAQLRRESGAAISQSEFDNAEQQYFPQPGNPPEVIEQKRQARQRAAENMRRSAGPALPPRATAAPAADDVPTISNDAEFDALPSGKEFVGPDGVRRKKP